MVCLQPQPLAAAPWSQSKDPLWKQSKGILAGLAGLAGQTLDVSGVALFAGGSFKNSVDPDGSLRSFAGAMPYGAFGMPIGHSRLKVAGAITPEFSMRAAWQYSDPPGTANVSYGSQKNESQFIAVRASSALAFAPSPKWALGASLGLVYNQNLLHAPYIFQQQPQLQGLKVLLDLRTNGFGWNGSAGAQWQPTPRIGIGASWRVQPLFRVMVMPMDLHPHSSQLWVSQLIPHTTIRQR